MIIQIKIRMAAVIAVCAIVMAGCGGKVEKQTADSVVSDTELISDSVAPVPKYLLTSEGIGPVEAGMPSRTWPDSISGLYDMVEEGPGGDADQYEFYLEGNPMVTVMDFGEGEADLVIVSDPSIKARVGDKELGLGDSFELLLRQPGVRAEWQQLDDEGMWYWNCKGIWFAPEQNNLPKSLADKLYDSTRAPEASDFPEEVGIGYMGTGLPF
ncbi:MAG: hypothetical protein NC328_04805 [Muribaculum sp.]|nr:hypothetical protein [Muribaculum sp.]